MSLAPPRGVTPPAPGLEREEPTFVREDDIPSDDGEERPLSREPGSGEDRPLREIERE